uniref:Uncharacterized protein n=1 Tax=Anguilla anguilla TaxID=7936 RepID=A0A0E9VAZ2_ANGAN
MCFVCVCVCETCQNGIHSVRLWQCTTYSLIVFTFFVLHCKSAPGVFRKHRSHWRQCQ